MNALRASFNLHRDPLPRNNFQMEVVLRPLPEGQLGKVRLTVCVNDRGANAITVSCGTRGGSNLEKKIAKEVLKRGLNIEVQTIKCLGLCDKGPNVRLAPGNNWFHDVQTTDTSELIDVTEVHMDLHRRVD